MYPKYMNELKEKIQERIESFKKESELVLEENEN